MPELISLEELCSHRSALIKVKCELQFDGSPAEPFYDFLLNLTLLEPD